MPHLGNADKLPLDDTVSSLGKYYLSSRSPLSHRPERWPWLGSGSSSAPLNLGQEGAASEPGGGLLVNKETLDWVIFGASAITF